MIAEGVETEDQKRFLAQTGCREMQGFLFSRALPEDQIADVMVSLRNKLGSQDSAGLASPRGVRKAASLS